MLQDADVELVLQTAGVIVALMFVSAPFYIRQAQASFEAVDHIAPGRRADARLRRSGERRACRDSGRTPRSARRGLALAWGRALGEFGATLMFAGSFRGITQTVPLAIYDQFATDFPAALALSAILVAVSAATAAGGQAGPGPGDRPRCCALSSATRSGKSSWMSRSTSPPVAAWRLPGRRAPARARSCGCWPGSSAPTGDGSPAATTSGSIRPRRLVAAGAPPLRLRVPGLRAVSAPQRVAQRRLRAAIDAAGVRGRPRRCRCSSGSDWPIEPMPSRRLCRAASASASRSRGRLLPIRPSCCSTNRCRHSTPALARAPRASSLRRFARSSCPSFSSPTSLARPRCSATRSAIIDDGAIIQRGSASELASSAG